MPGHPWGLLQDTGSKWGILNVQHPVAKVSLHGCLAGASAQIPILCIYIDSITWTVGLYWTLCLEPHWNWALSSCLPWLPSHSLQVFGTPFSSAFPVSQERSWMNRAVPRVPDPQLPLNPATGPHVPHSEYGPQGTLVHNLLTWTL